MRSVGQSSVAYERMHLGHKCRVSLMRESPLSVGEGSCQRAGLRAVAAEPLAVSVDTDCSCIPGKLETQVINPARGWRQICERLEEPGPGVK